MVLKGWVRWTLGRKMWSTLNLSREQKSWKRERKCKTFKPQLVSIVLVNFMLCLYWMFYDSISPLRLDVSFFFCFNITIIFIIIFFILYRFPLMVFGSFSTWLLSIEICFWVFLLVILRFYSCQKKYIYIL